ncbi:MHC class II transactivator isoform X1 [Osmerus eperlanus]|uniref:MHC class II transactivator isoform X1 n=2 Tax=Osmerus eperlanus TaxID=29151 RepID=UPI002E103EEA
MAPFEEVLGLVRLALSCSSPWEIKAFLEALVELQVISRHYSSNLRSSLTPGSSRRQSGAALEWSQPGEEGHLDLLWSRLEPERKLSVGSYLPQQQDLERGTDRAEGVMENDNWRTGVEEQSQDQGRMEETWMEEQNGTEEMEEVIRRIALPLWQNWERGQRVLLPLLAWITSDTPTDRLTVSMTTDKVTHNHKEEYEEEEQEVGETGTPVTHNRMQEVNEDLPPSLLLDYGEQFLKDLDTIDIHSLLDSNGDFTDSFLDLLEYQGDGDGNLATAEPPPDVSEKKQKQSRRRRRGQGSEDSPEMTVDSLSKRRRREGAGMEAKRKPRSRKLQEHTLPRESAGPPPAGVMDLPTSPLTVLQFSPSLHPSTHSPIQLVPLLGSPMLGHSPPLLSLLLSMSTTPPTYILVPAPSQVTPPQVVPLSPHDGAVAPDHMGSSPQGSLSDCTSKALSPASASPLSPNTGVSQRKGSPPSTSSAAMSGCVKDYLQQAKAHMRETCQEMEAGLRLDSHYVDLQLVPKQILSNGSKSPDKDLVVMRDVEQNLGWQGSSQMFQNTEESKAKRYIVLLGNSGMGKSTFIKKLSLDWSNGSLPQFDFMFVLDGKALALTEQTYSLQSLLLRLSSSAPHCHAPEAVFTRVLSSPKRVLLVFDGFDRSRDYEGLLLSRAEDFQGRSRAQSYSVRQLYSGLLQRRLLASCSLLLCVRDRGVGSQLLRRADCLLELRGFSSSDTQAYLDLYFPEPGPRAIAVEQLQKHRYLLSLCWNPGLCRAVCLVLEHHRGSEPLPSSLTELWSRVLRVKLRNKRTQNGKLAKTGTLTHSVSHSNEDIHTPRQINGNTRINTRSHTQIQTLMEAKEIGNGSGKEEEERKERKMEGELLSQMSSSAWEGLKGHSSVLSLDHTVSDRLRRLGLRCGLVHSHSLRVSEGDKGERQRGLEPGGDEQVEERNRGRRGTEGITGDHILSWSHSFLRSFLGGAHLTLSRAVSDRSLLFQAVPSQPRGRRRTQGEGLDLAQRFAIGLLFRNKEELQDLLAVDTGVMDIVLAKRSSMKAHLEGLNHGDLSPAHLLEVCHYVHETGDARLARHLVKSLPEDLSFDKVPLHPPDAYVVWNLLKNHGTQRRKFCLRLEDTGIRICGLRALVSLRNVSSYRACIADTTALWEELENNGEKELLEEAVNKLVINPFRAGQVCHIDHLAQLVHIHTHRRLPGSQSVSVLAEGIPAVRDLYKLEYDLGPVYGPLALPKLLEVLPALHSLQHLDLENSKMGDSGAEDLAKIITSLSSLQILNLSQNCIGDQGAERLAASLCTLPSLHCLSLYHNVISDGGAQSLAAVLHQMASLTDLDVKYNKFTDVGAQHLACSLRKCPWIKSLGMWNEYIPYREFERLQEQDSRIHSL